MNGLHGSLLNRVQTIQHVQLILPAQSLKQTRRLLIGNGQQCIRQSTFSGRLIRSLWRCLFWSTQGNLNLDKVAEMLIEKVGIQLSGNRRQATETASVKQLTNRQAWHLLIIKNVVDPSSLTGRILRRRTHKLVPSSSSFYTMFHFAVFL